MQCSSRQNVMMRPCCPQGDSTVLQVPTASAERSHWRGVPGAEAGRAGRYQAFGKEGSGLADDKPRPSPGDGAARAAAGTPACLARQLPHDWHERCRIRPRAAGDLLRNTPLRRHVLPRRQLDPSGPDPRPRQAGYSSRVRQEPVKNILVKPLCKDWKAILNRQDRSIPRCPLERLRPGCRARTANPLTGKALSRP